MIKLLRNRKGMSLVEAGITITIISLVSICLLSVLTDSLQGWQYGTGKTIATDTATIGAQKLLNDIRDGKSASVVTVSGVDELRVVFPATVMNGSEKTYDLSANDPTPRIYAYDSNNMRITKKLGLTGTPVTFIKNVSSATFGAHNGEVNITLVGQQTGAKSKTYEQTVQMRINLRNYRN